MYVSRNGQSYGPFSREDLWGHFQSGAFVATDLAWHEGMAEWTQLTDLFEPAPIPVMPVAPVAPAIAFVPKSSELSVKTSNSISNTGIRQNDSANAERIKDSPRKSSKMMKKIGVGLVGICVVAGLVWYTFIHQTEVSFEELVMEDNVVYLRDDTKSFTGVAISTFPNGKLKVRVEFQEGRENGMYELWHEDGTLIHQAEYSKGSYSGPVKWWTPEGKLAIEAEFSDGREVSSKTHIEFEIPFDTIPRILPRTN